MAVLCNISYRKMTMQTVIKPPIQWVLGDRLPGVKRPGREADHSPPSSAEVRNGGAIPPLPHTRTSHVVMLN
jgi:hypothetical protein